MPSFFTITKKDAHMSKPKKQHFIPGSYLRNFADVENKKAYVEVMNVNTKEIKYPFSVSNISVSKKVYSFPSVNKDDRYFTERFYAQNVESVYPEVYSILTNPEILDITNGQRNKILYTCLSIYFRTARFLNEKNDTLDVRTGEQNINPGEGEANTFVEPGGIYAFKRKDVRNVKQKTRIDARRDFIIRHLEDWQNFVRFKNTSQITVNEILGPVELITCDNPVRIFDNKSSEFNLFDPANSIQVPLDQRHLLWISPNSDEIEPNQIFRQEREKWFAITSNQIIQQDASDWIISKKGGIIKHLEEQKQYDDFTPENRQVFENVKTISSELSKLVEFARANGGITSELSLQRLRELKQILPLANDPGFQTLISKLALNGYNV